MQVHQVILARALQMFRSASGTIGYYPALVNDVRNRYGFVSIPGVDDILGVDPNKGAEFQHGRMENSAGTIIIDKFTVWRDGLVADSSSSTDEMDIFLSDFQEWAKLAAPKAVTVGPRYYLSQLEVNLNLPLADYAPTFGHIGDHITEVLNGYGIPTPKFETSAIHLYFDTHGRRNPIPGSFMLDRRQGFPYADNLWFSQAPLKTPDHVGLLEVLDGK